MIHDAVRRFFVVDRRKKGQIVKIGSNPNASF
jgi:hypothetical protein